MSDKVCAICKKKPPYSKQAKYCQSCGKKKELVTFKVYSQNHRAKKLGVAGTFTVTEWKALCDKYGKKCLCCGIQGDYHTLAADHVIALATGGTNYISNIQPLCKSCNSGKQHRIGDYRNETKEHHPRKAQSRISDRWS